MRGESMKGKSKKSTYSTTFGVDPISIGERTGSLVHAFSEINNNHRDSLNKRIKFATIALGGIALGGAFFLVFIFAMGIVLSILGLSQSLTPQ